jgi:orotidine-5'-phosphate decarboxylase
VPAASAAPPRRAIAPRERLIVALDFAAADDARRLVQALGDAACFYKVGLELFCADGAFRLVRELVDAGHQVFLDFKLFDIPATVAAAVRNARGSGARFLTVHASRRVLEAACAERGDLGVLAVTVLTSFDAADLRDLGHPPSVTAEELALQRARTALATGCEGVVTSPLEARRIRAEVGAGLAIVTPGIRPEGAAGGDDQRRVATPRAAFEAGADYVVVGRPIRQARDPRAAALAVQETIADLFG